MVVLPLLNRLGIDLYQPLKAAISITKYGKTILEPVDNEAQFLLVLANVLKMPENNMLELLQNILFCMNIDIRCCQVVLESTNPDSAILSQTVANFQGKKVLNFGVDVESDAITLTTLDLGTILSQPKMKQKLYEDIRTLSF